ncbi:MAG: hypothetical protein QOG38_2707 [Hyphomicrobiales bacterium]|nr:hypothetical protein [Hyphomicrobiales bacterium]
MTRHGLFAILALTGALIIPDPTLARPNFRPAFTTGPFRIVLPTGRPHFSGGPRVHAMTPRPATAKVLKPVVRTAAGGPAPFRTHRRFHGSLYPVTVTTEGSYYGTPYDPSDIPVYAPPVSADDAAAPVSALPPPIQVAAEERGCRAQRLLVPMANGQGESEITIVRC